MLPVAIDSDAVRFGDRFVLRFERTLRVPDDGSTYPLPPGLGRFRIYRVEDFRDRVPPKWSEEGGVFISMHQAEAMWLSFDAAPWKPSAVTVGVGKVNAISGAAWPDVLHASPQNYLVCPPQLWLDGINAGAGFVRQFVAMPLGRNITVEGQLTGVEAHGGMQVRVYDPKPGRFPDTPPPGSNHRTPLPSTTVAASITGMGFVPGGRIEQKVIDDPVGVDAWDPDRYGTLIVHVLNTAQHEAVTGQAAPPPMVSARTYTDHGFPWFRHYEDSRVDVPAPETLAALASLAEFSETGADSFTVPSSQVVNIERARRRTQREPKGD